MDSWNTKPVSRIVVLVPYEHLDMARALAKKTSNEFMWYSKVERMFQMDSVLYVLVSNEIYFPEQYVSPSSCKPTDEELRKISEANYDVVFHRHPSGLSSFSTVDDEYINSNNKVSVLFVDGEFKNASVRTQLGDFFILNRAEVEVVYPTTRINVDELLGKLKTYSYDYGGYYGYYGGYYGYYGSGGLESTKSITEEFREIAEKIPKNLKDELLEAERLYLSFEYLDAHDKLSEIMTKVKSKKLRKKIQKLADRIYEIALEGVVR